MLAVDSGLFRATAATLLQAAANPQRLGAAIGGLPLENPGDRRAANTMSRILEGSLDPIGRQLQSGDQAPGARPRIPVRGHRRIFGRRDELAVAACHGEDWRCATP